MVFALLFFIELFILFLLSRTMTQLVSSLFYHLTKSKKVTVHLLAILFFPGTLFHELAHAIMAGILFVPVSNMNLIPKIEEDGVKLGSVAIARTDPFRRLLIGMAPFLFGTCFLLGLLYFATTNNLFSNYFVVFLIGYLIFEIGNTMFSSKKDMEGAIELLAVVLFFLLVFYFLGFRVSFSSAMIFENPIVVQVLQHGIFFLLVPLAIDICIIGLMKLFHK